MTAMQCETRFIELERKLQKVEAALTIIEAKLASIPDQGYEHAEAELRKQENSNETVPESSDVVEISLKDVGESPKCIKVSEHALYKKFFKMQQVGVPPQAIKMKMQIEGLDPNLLDNCNLLITLDESETDSKQS